MTTTLIVPGLNASGPAHWQTWLEDVLPDAVRVVQRDWKRPDLPEWTSRIRRAIVREAAPVVIAAHSFGALAAVQAADDLSPHVAGLLLVAPVDPDKFAAADVLPSRRLDVPATIVASTNDRWLSFARAAELASLWGADLVSLGAAGHINAESGYGPWPGSLELLARFGGGESLTKSSYPERQQAMIRARVPRSAPALAERHAQRESAAHGLKTPLRYSIADNVRV